MTCRRRSTTAWLSSSAESSGLERAAVFEAKAVTEIRTKQMGSSEPAIAE